MNKTNSGHGPDALVHRRYATWMSEEETEILHASLNSAHAVAIMCSLLSVSSDCSSER